jgi:hypothetical protein
MILGAGRRIRAPVLQEGFEPGKPCGIFALQACFDEPGKGFMILLGEFHGKGVIAVSQHTQSGAKMEAAGADSREIRGKTRIGSAIPAQNSPAGSMRRSSSAIADGLPQA